MPKYLKNCKARIVLSEKGKELNKEKIAAELKTPDYIPNNPYPPGCEIQGGYCIDHYWVTYNEETGEILSIDYVGSDCYSICLSGGGNGGGTPPNTASCTALANTMADATYSANEVRTITYNNNSNGQTREVFYRWICLINYGGWGLLSTEKGVHKKVKDVVNPWIFQSFTHINVVKEGISLGRVVEHTETPITTMGTYNAGIQLLISLDFKVACTPLVVRHTNHTSQYHFNVNDPGISPS